MSKTKSLVVEKGTVKFSGKYYPCGSVIPDVPKQVADDLIKDGLCRMAEKDDLEPAEDNQVDLEKDNPFSEEHSQEKEN